jgi:D-alanyl-D-alanine carboxypeptidase
MAGSSSGFFPGLIDEGVCTVNRATGTRLASMACAVLALRACAPAASVTAASRNGAAIGDVQKAMDALAEVDGVVAAIGEVYVDGKRAGKGSSGSRLLGGRGGKIPSDARYRIGSQTKSMTATVALQLVKEGGLSLDAELSEVLPEVAARDLVQRADEITVRDLITMVSGIPDYYNGPRAVSPFDFTTNYSRTDLLEISRKESRTSDIGTWQYSNTNYLLLTMIIERLSGRSLAAELDRRIFKPLGMAKSHLPMKPPQGITGPHGHGYQPDGSGRPRDMDRLNASTLLGAGGVVSTARDVSAFYRAFTQGRLLPPSLQKVITDPAPGEPPHPAGGPCEGKPDLSSRDGSAPGFAAATYTTPDGRTQIAMSMTTSAGPAGRDAASKRFRDAVVAVFCPAE